MEITADNLLSIYRGKLAEQFVGQELLAWHSKELYYWQRNAKNSDAEVDYLTVHKGHIYPVEIKSGAGGSLKSLHQMLKDYPNCTQGLVLYGGPWRQLPEQKITFLPLYATPCIGDREQIEP